MALPFLDLIKAQTSDQIKATALSILEALEFPVASWHAGAVVRTVVALLSRIAAPFTDTMALVAKSGWLDYAADDWLDVVSEQVFRVVRVPATFATGTLRLDNSQGGVFPFAIGAFRVYNPTTKKTYRNTTAFTLNALETNKQIPIEAIEIGSASTSAAGTITALETILNGVTVTNEAVVSGFDKETDPNLRSRCRAKLGSLSPNGPPDAYDYIARSFDLNGGVLIDRTRVVKDSNTGDVVVYLAGPSGAVTAPDVAKVQDAYERLCAPLCIDPTAVSAGAITINIVCTVWIYTYRNMKTTDVQTAIQAALLEWVKTIGIGGDVIPAGTGAVFYDAIEGEIRKAVPIITVSVTTPAADFAVLGSQVVQLGTVTTTVVQVTK